MGIRTVCLLAGLLLATPAPAQDVRRHDGKTAQEWIALLDSKDAPQRRAAVTALNALEHRSVQATQALIRRLKDADVQVRIEATFVIPGVIPEGGPTRAVVAALGTALASDTEESVRSGAADALGILGEGAAAAVPSLVAGLNDPSVSVRRAVVLALSAMDARAEPAIPTLRKLVRDRKQDRMLRQFAASALGDLQPRGETITVLIEAASDRGSAALRYAAVVALGEAPKREDARVLPTLIAALKDPVRVVRMGAAGAFRHLGKRAASAVPALTVALAEAKVAGIAAISLGRIGPTAKPAVPALIALLKHADPKLRSSVCAGLRELGPPAEAAVPRLTVLLSSDLEVEVRRSAAAALRTIRERSKRAPAALLTAVADDVDPRVRALACQALGCIRGDAAEAALVKALGDRSDLVRGQAAYGLGLLAKRSTSGPLLAALTDAKARVRSRAAEALGRSRDARKQVRRALIRALERDADRWTRAQAALALGRLGRSTGRVRRALEGALLHRDEDVQLGAATGIAMLQPDDRTGGAVLARLLRSKAARMRRRTLWILATETLGPKVRVAVVGRLAEIATKDPHAGARGDACRALAKLAPGTPAKVVLEKVAAGDPSYFTRQEAAELLEEMSAGG